ncbi:MAG: alkaline phosphatase D family protein [Burkholderiales bacterium]|nr:alkaline phosphatase D family protein [Burkholderiales bacterium]
MPTRIAFGSCSRYQKYPSQPVWDHLKGLNPDHLLLLGDQIYMDFGLKPFGGNLYEPKGMSFSNFVRTMHGHYRQQYAVPEFQQFLHSLEPGRVHCTWDDHDFAWNNAVGGCADEKHTVDANIRKASRQLFEQYRRMLNQPATDYPPLPDAVQVELAVPDLGGVQSSFVVEGVRVILLDLRTWADMPECGDWLIGKPWTDTGGPPPPAETESGWQDYWLQNELAQPEQEIILCSSLTLTKGTSWDDYAPAYNRLMDLLHSRNRKVLFLSGDIHVNHLKTHANRGWTYPIHEATSSGFAIHGYKASYFGDLRNSGCLDIDADRITVKLFRDVSQPDGELSFSRTTWR